MKFPNYQTDPPKKNLECGGRAQRRHRFSTPATSQSGVALRFPPQSKIISGLATII